LSMVINIVARQNIFICRWRRTGEWVSPVKLGRIKMSKE
jgi:hypothetical protein